MQSLQKLTSKARQTQLTLKIRRCFSLADVAAFFKSGEPQLLGPSNKKVGPAPPDTPGSDAYGNWLFVCLYWCILSCFSWGVVWFLVISLVPLQIFSWLWQWNNFENRLIFDEVKAYKKQPFLGPPCTSFMWDHLLETILSSGRNTQSMTLKQSSSFSIVSLKIYEVSVATRT